jgi:hypothetical protein
MKCTGCGSPMLYSGGENKKDYSCSTPKTCPCWTEICYYPHASVEPGWWFLREFHLPFKHKNQWFSIHGPVSEYYEYECDEKGELVNVGTKEEQFTVLSALYNYNFTWNNCNQVPLLQIPYAALPANEDFTREFEKIIQHPDIQKYLATIIEPIQYEYWNDPHKIDIYGTKINCGQPGCAICTGYNYQTKPYSCGIERCNLCVYNTGKIIENDLWSKSDTIKISDLIDGYYTPYKR